MAEVQIKKMRITHEMILNWMMLNPEKSQGECAEFFNVTQSWISIIVNSDVFKMRWLQKRQMLDRRSLEVAEAKMRGVVDKGLDRLEQMVEVSEDPTFVLNTTDKLLGRLGYGAKAPAQSVNVQQNTFLVSKEMLAEARRVIDAPRPELRTLEAPAEPPEVQEPDSRPTSAQPAPWTPPRLKS